MYRLRRRWLAISRQAYLAIHYVVMAFDSGKLSHGVT
jgi:hypothetical protein